MAGFLRCLHRNGSGGSRRRLIPAVVLAIVAAVSACSSPGAAAGGASGGGVLRLGYFANLTHASAILGVSTGAFQRELGTTALQTQVFNAGPAAVEALLAGAIDAAYVGPNPAINAYVKSGGQAVRIVAGATSSGASLVVRPGLTVADLRGKTLASPQLGGTQDVALRSWLAKNGLTTSVSGAADVTIAPQDNAQSLELFKAGKIDGAWLPEPWATRLRVEAGGVTLVDEATLWPQGRFVTTHLLVSTAYLQSHPDQVTALLRGAIAIDAAIAKDPTGSRDAVGAQIARLTGKALPAGVLTEAWSHLTVTLDPVASSLQASADAALAAGLTKQRADLTGIYDLRPLNALLAAAGKPTVSAGGLGKE